ncbi:MAG: flagellar biosynthesis protein FlhB [Tepidisphaeraceae bacterium]
MGDKTEAPTPKRRSEARSRGNIARSPDLTSASLLLGAIMLLNWYGAGLVEAMRTVMAEMLGPDSFTDFSSTNAAMSILRAILTVGRALMPLFLGVLLIAILVNLAQVGLFFNTNRLQPNLAALNPFKGLGKLFGGRGNKLFQMAMNTVKMSLVAMAAYSAIHGRMGEIITVQQLSFMQIFGLGAEIIYAIAIRIGVLLLVLAILDYCYQKWNHEKQLKMSKQEVKEEMRSMDGDPKIKAKRRQIQMQMALQRIKQDVPTADVVVTNPTHFSVALKYDKDNMHAPRVVAKGADYMAFRIREVAVAHGVPILERPPLARSLYKLVEVGQEIPEEFYAAVAEILAYVYELSGKAVRRQAVAV